MPGFSVVWRHRHDNMPSKNIAFPHGKDVRFPYCVNQVEKSMLAKLTAKNQLTLPKAVVASVELTEYFDVSVDNGRIILTPVHIQQAQAAREKLEQLGITKEDIDAAVAWSRR